MSVSQLGIEVFGSAPADSGTGAAAAVWVEVYAHTWDATPATARLARAAEPGPVWLLDVDLPGGPIYLATRPVEVPSRRAGGLRRYGAGLPDLRVERGVESLGVTVRVPDVEALRRRGPIRGRTFALRLYRGEPVLEDAEVLLRGRVAGSSWAPPGAPDLLELALDSRRGRGDERVVPDAGRVSRLAWPDALDGAVGSAIPLVIGRPGAADGDDAAYPATPAVAVGYGILTRTLAIAAHPVDAAAVTLYDLAESPPTTVTGTPATTTDDLGRDVATTTASTLVIPVDADDVAVSWTSDGLHWEGRAVRGLGTLLLWGAVHRSREVHDLGRLRAERARLDRYLVDACVNDTALRWDAWLGEWLPDYGVEAVEGPLGRYYREVTWTPSRGDLRAVLTEGTVGGLRVRRVGPWREDAGDDLASSVRVEYGHRVDGEPTRWIEYRARADEDDPRIARHPACVAAAALGGAPITVAALTTDRATARLVGLQAVERYSRPGYLGDFVGGPELGRVLALWDAVELRDADDVVRYGVVVAVELSEGTTLVAVRVPG